MDCIPKNSIWLWAILMMICMGCTPHGQTNDEGALGPTVNPLPGITPLSARVATETSTGSITTPESVPITSAIAPAPTRLVSSHPVPGIELEFADDEALNLVLQAGAHWVRRNALNWSAVEPEEGQRDWPAIADFEAEMKSTAELGLEQIIIVRGTPDWAQKTSGYPCSAVSEDKIQAFARFLQDAVERYGAEPYDVSFWEIANEPDVAPAEVPADSPFGCWGDPTDPYYGGGYFTEVLREIYPAIKLVDSDARVLIGGLLLDCDPVNPPEGKSCKPAQFLEGILSSGGGELFDGISFHAYDYYIGFEKYGNPNWNSSWNSTGPVLTAKVRYIRSLLAAYQFPGKILINSEAGLLCPDANDGPVCRSIEFELTKAAYVAQANTTAQVEGLWANVWYSLTGWRGTGLVDVAGAPNRAFQAYQFNANWLSGAIYSRMQNEIPGVRGYEFMLHGERRQILWAVDDKEHSYRFEQAPHAIFDMLGEPVSPTGEVRITRQPVYIEWDK